MLRHASCEDSSGYAMHKPCPRALGKLEMRSRAKAPVPPILQGSCESFGGNRWASGAQLLQDMLLRVRTPSFRDPRDIELHALHSSVRASHHGVPALTRRETVCRRTSSARDRKLSLFHPSGTRSPGSKAAAALFATSELSSKRSIALECRGVFCFDTDSMLLHLAACLATFCSTQPHLALVSDGVHL